ncbi:MAG: hypothetical protein L3J28_05295 [Candidatus Polarisedimenticolaceae bacterium]|nr:hypothetical protein [Candidatus Polarisedimenticolaceae bacterium]
MSRQFQTFISIVLLMFTASVSAGNLIMVRTVLPFESAVETLKVAIAEAGYTVLDDSLVDISLVSASFSTPKYKAIMLESRVGTAELLDRHPMLASFLPLRITIFAEDESSVLVSLNPVYLENYYPDEELAGFFWQWNRDIQQILSSVMMARP